MVAWTYYKACTVSPGYPTDPVPPSPPLPSWAPYVPFFLPPSLRPLSSSHHNSRRESVLNRIRTAQSLASTSSTFIREAEATPREREKPRTCRKCPPSPTGLAPIKPERTHHCSVCRRCVLAYDHHCPWVNQCIGHHNLRYFTLFLLFFSLACGSVPYWCWGPAWKAIDFFNEWPHKTPRSFTLGLFLLSSIMSIAVFIMFLFQIQLLLLATTPVESHDNTHYSHILSLESPPRTFINPYDLGPYKNFLRGFNLYHRKYHEEGYSWWTLVLPLEVPAVGDGWEWEKRRGWETGSVAREGELTDEEEFSGDEG